MESSGYAAAAQASFQSAEFFAEDELIEISPMVSSGVIPLLCGDFGPFEPSIAISVPVWLALAMKRLKRCKIIPPRWLELRVVESVIQDEKDDDGALQPLPRYFFQISSLLLHRGEDDLVSPSRLRRAIEDLSSLRTGKMRRWMQANVRERMNAIKINNLTSLEVEMHRPVLTKVLDGLYDMHVQDLDVDSTTASNVAPSSSAFNTSSEPRQPVRILRR